MSKLQDIITQAILDGGLYSGQVLLNTPGATTDAAFGVYNPTSSGVQAIITQLNWFYGGSQPIPNPFTVSGLSISTPWLVSYRSISGHLIPAPSTTQQPFRQKFGSNPQAPDQSTNSPLLCLDQSDYVTPTFIGAAYVLPVYADIQPGVDELGNYFDLTSTYPLILYPGDIFIGSGHVDLTNGGTITSSWLKIDFVQVAV